MFQVRIHGRGGQGVVTAAELLSVAALRDTDGQPGFSFAEREWPHGWKGVGSPHGAVFTR